MHFLQKAIRWSYCKAVSVANCKLNATRLMPSNQFLPPAAINLRAEDKQLAECGGPKHKHPQQHFRSTRGWKISGESCIASINGDNLILHWLHPQLISICIVAALRNQ